MPYKPPKQRRSQESLERVLDATESLIRERGFEQMTIADVVQRSGSSVGSFYARFSDKVALLMAVQARYQARLEARAAAEFGTESPRFADLDAAIHRIVGALCDYLLHEPELFRAFFLQAISDPGVRAQGEAANAKRREQVAAALLQHRNEIKHPNPDLAARWFYQFCMAFLRERITFGPAAELSGGLDDAVVRSELYQTAAAYLLSEGRNATGRPPD